MPLMGDTNLQVCMEFFCDAVKEGITLRGCILTGMATMNQKNLFISDDRW